MIIKEQMFWFGPLDGCLIFFKRNSSFNHIILLLLSSLRLRSVISAGLVRYQTANHFLMDDMQIRHGFL